MKPDKKPVNPRADSGLPVASTPRKEREPRTKAAFIRELCFPDEPEFPLDGEILAEVPDGLPGKIPRNLSELWELEDNPRPNSVRRKPLTGPEG